MSATATAQRVFNFSAGPAALPLPVLQQVQEELLCLPGAGASVMEISHRGKVFVDIIHDAEATLRSLLGISRRLCRAVPAGWGGAAVLDDSRQSASRHRQDRPVPAHRFVGQEGDWRRPRRKATSRRSLTPRIPITITCPRRATTTCHDDAAYLYYCSNETIQGVQFAAEPECPASRAAGQ